MGMPCGKMTYITAQEDEPRTQEVRSRNPQRLVSDKGHPLMIGLAPFMTARLPWRIAEIGDRT